MRIVALGLAAVAAALLAACGGGEEAAVPESDPALTAALATPIMVDTDLAGQNRANSAVAMPSQDGSLPTVDSGPEAIAAARNEALRMVGGPGRMKRAPEANDAGSMPAIPEGCTERAEKTARWAARMPSTFPVYPRGAVEAAAGTDAAGCALRVVSFETPVPLGEVIDFYFTRARAAGYSAHRVAHDGDDVLSGAKGAVVYSVRAGRLPSGNTKVDLVTSRSR